MVHEPGFYVIEPQVWMLLSLLFSHQVVCLTLLRPHGLEPARLLCPWDFPGKNTEVDCHFLLQGIFPTQGSNPCLLLGRWIRYHLATWEVPPPQVWTAVCLISSYTLQRALGLHSFQAWCSLKTHTCTLSLDTDV